MIALSLFVILMLGFATLVSNARNPARLPETVETELARIVRLRFQLKCQRLRRACFKIAGDKP